MIKKGYQVKILCGKDKGKKGEVIEILRSQNKAKIKGINIIKKHEKTTKEKKGGIISKEDMKELFKLGVGKLFGPGTPVNETIEYIESWVSDNRN